jgi:hypothetical protein
MLFDGKRFTVLSEVSYPRKKTCNWDFLQK